jgi:hypothetical protein
MGFELRAHACYLFALVMFGIESYVFAQVIFDPDSPFETACIVEMTGVPLCPAFIN